MHVGLALPQRPGPGAATPPPPWHAVVSWARAAEAAGLDSLWMADDGGSGSRVESALDPLTALAGVARRTTSARLGASVGWLRRPPAVLAKALATLDVVSGGRVTLALAAGTGEGRATPADLAEVLEVLRLAFTGEAFSFAGRHVRLDGMRCRPRPVQRPGPPVWVEGDGDEVVDVVARSADGWTAPGWSGSPTAYRQRATALARACEAAGRDPAGVERGVHRLALVGEDERDLRRRWERACALAHPPAGTLEEFRAGRLVGTVEQVGEQVAAWADAGVTTLVVSPGALPFAVTDVDDLAPLASAVRQR